MDELEHYLARRRRRRKFALKVSDLAEPDTWARLAFDSQISILSVEGRVIEEMSFRDLRLSVEGNGLMDAEDRMVALGWRPPERRGSSAQRLYFRRPVPPDDTPATYDALARRAAAAVLGTDRYLLTIEPYQGEARYLGEAALYGSLVTMGGFVVGVPIAILVALAAGNALEVALVASVLVAIAALYWTRPYALDGARVRLLAHLSESAIIEVPIVGPLIEGGIGWGAISIGVWLPIAVAIVITAAG